MFDLDTTCVELDCPQCRFHTTVRMREVRLRDAIICRGCKSVLQLDDYLNSVRKGMKSITGALTSLEDAIQPLNITIRL